MEEITRIFRAYLEEECDWKHTVLALEDYMEFFTLDARAGIQYNKGMIFGAGNCKKCNDEKPWKWFDDVVKQWFVDPHNLPVFDEGCWFDNCT